VICEVANCGKPRHQRGLCKAHHMKLWRYGDPYHRQPTTLERFWTKIRRDENGCWLWQAGLAHNGYGHLKVGRRTVKAHRFAYELLVGPVLEHLELDHLCRVRSCVNPAHLEPVTHAENVRRGRAGWNLRREAA
jgi:hypothetical protein